MRAYKMNSRNMPASPIQFALLVIIVIFIILFVCRLLRSFRQKHEGFVSKRAQEVHDRAQEVFSEGGGDANYSSYKNKVPGADPVQYSDVRKLYRKGKMTPQAVERVM